MKWKVCGMRDPENIAALLALQPDYLGFIFWEHSKRFVTEALPPIPETVKKVGVFVDATTATINTQVQKHQLDAVQLHGQESPEQCEALKASGVTIIKAFAVGPAFDFTLLEAYEAHCDYFLLDTKGKAPGGNGLKFNWELLRNYPSTTPFFLSGGIGPEDAAALQELTKTKLPLYAIDLNSKFELQPGLKDITALQQFNTQLRCNTM